MSLPSPSRKTHVPPKSQIMVFVDTKIGPKTGASDELPTDFSPQSTGGEVFARLRFPQPDGIGDHPR